MRQTFDPTAGRTARQIQEHPSDPRRIMDPTDSRYGEFQPESNEHGGNPPRIEDPTDPRAGQSGS